MEGFDYWIWIAGGIVLALLELLIPTFFALLFGLSAIVVGLITLIFPDLSLQLQLVVWSVLAIVSSILWFKVFKPSKTPPVTRDAMVGQVAMVIEDITPERQGVIRFTIPVLGESQWKATAIVGIQTGERVKVIDVDDQTLIVEKLTAH
ncbi:NfeD family protein [Aestuariicella sp. G3-2]|uniref:NfeD family protein n=1 Tax=Pseudomaricurvus albidus TaxID=2842452 RepID=UPI001C0BDC02|nr:NfeD family protein [Aestuariicella albida]MBU3070100.1 NfeD family protein [Aestuariicella albida]